MMGMLSVHPTLAFLMAQPSQLAMWLAAVSTSLTTPASTPKMESILVRTSQQMFCFRNFFVIVIMRAFVTEGGGGGRLSFLLLFLHYGTTSISFSLFPYICRTAIVCYLFFSLPSFSLSVSVFMCSS